MKIILKQILKYYLKIIVRLVLLIHRPLIIGITGSVNEIFTKNEIKRQLTEAHYEVRSNPKNFNTEIGLPLAILNLPSGYNSYINWLPVIWQALKSVFYLKFPKILVIELGVAKPGDMKYLLSLIRPKIGVITDITQRYVEGFSDMDKLVGEYEYFVKSINKKGYLVLNRDNQRIQRLTKIRNNNIVFFGLEKSSAENEITVKEDYWQGEAVNKTFNGQTVRIIHGGQTENCQINRFGEHHIYALLAGLIVKKLVLNFK